MRAVGPGWTRKIRRGEAWDLQGQRSAGITLARISQTGRYIRALDLRKSSCTNGLSQGQGPGGDPVPTEDSGDLFGFAPVERRAVVAGFDGGRMTSDAGALLLGVTDRAIGLIERFAACFTDGRRAELTEHEVRTLVGQRVFGIALGYEDLIDHDQLRHDPTLAVLAGKLAARRQGCAPLAGKSTLNRLELGGPTMTRYHRIAWDAAKIEALFIDLFLEAHPQPPKQIILDLDATDDPLHGHQEGRFFHGYYDCYCYLPLYIFCGPHLLAAKQRCANIDAAAGAVARGQALSGELVPVRQRGDRRPVFRQDRRHTDRPAD